MKLPFCIFDSSEKKRCWQSREEGGREEASIGAEEEGRSCCRSRLSGFNKKSRSFGLYKWQPRKVEVSVFWKKKFSFFLFSVGGAFVAKQLHCQLLKWRTRRQQTKKDFFSQKRKQQRQQQEQACGRFFWGAAAQVGWTFTDRHFVYTWVDVCSTLP